MEILILVLLYYLSQNPDFHESVKPLMGQLKNSEQMLAFLNDLAKFSQTFSTFQQESKEKTPPADARRNDPPPPPNAPSPTSGIADDFIQKMLNDYLKKDGTP